MFPAAKAQFDLALAWSELAMSTFTATTMMATAGAKVMTANAEAERISRQPAQGLDALLAPWMAMTTPAPQAGLADPMRFAQAATQATLAFWSTLLGSPLGQSPRPYWSPNFDVPPARPAKPAAVALPLWWTAFTDPAVPALTQQASKGPAPRSPYLH